MPEMTLTAQERHQLLAVLRELDPSAPPEKRRMQRRKVFLNQWIRKVGSEGGGMEALVVNVSARGLGLICQGSMAVGERFLIALKLEGASWLVLCQARNVRKLAIRGWRVGAVFLDRVENPTAKTRIPGDWLN